MVTANLDSYPLLGLFGHKWTRKRPFFVVLFVLRQTALTTNCSGKKRATPQKSPTLRMGLSCLCDQRERLPHRRWLVVVFQA